MKRKNPLFKHVSRTLPPNSGANELITTRTRIEPGLIHRFQHYEQVQRDLDIRSLIPFPASEYRTVWRVDHDGSDNVLAVAHSKEWALKVYFSMPEYTDEECDADAAIELIFGQPEAVAAASDAWLKLMAKQALDDMKSILRAMPEEHREHAVAELAKLVSKTDETRENAPEAA